MISLTEKCFIHLAASKGGKDCGSAKKEKKKEKSCGDKSQKETPKKEVPPPQEEELDPTESALAEEPKSKDPFEALPKGYVI